MRENVEDLDLLTEVKKKYMEDVQTINIEEIKKEAEKDKETVTLYHGTSSNRLNLILREGILPRKDTGIDNWKGDGEEKSSIDNVVYMTNKWHYFYATNTVWVVANETGSYIGEYGIIYPCYIECKVPKSLLVMDEDFIKTRYMIKKITSTYKKGRGLVFDPLECLSQYGTVGVLGGISPSMIVSFTVLGGVDIFKYIIDEESPYYKEWLNWQLGQGKGKIKLKQMWEKEAECNMNGTWYTHEVKKNSKVSFKKNPSTGNIAMVQSKV